MFVVRYTTVDGREDFKAFTSDADARRRFGVANLRIPDDISSAFLFHVPDETDARRAVEAVKMGQAQIIERDRWHELTGEAERLLRETGGFDA